MIFKGCKVVLGIINKFDDSKEDSKVGCAVISGNHSNMQHIPDKAKAVDLALNFIRTCDTNNKFIIFSDWL